MNHCVVDHLIYKKVTLTQGISNGEREKKKKEVNPCKMSKLEITNITKNFYPIGSDYICAAIM